MKETSMHCGMMKSRILRRRRQMNIVWKVTGCCGKENTKKQCSRICMGHTKKIQNLYAVWECAMNLSLA